MQEKDIEQSLVKQVKMAGGQALKFVSPGHNGVPDRLILLPHGNVAFAEMKAPGKKMRPLQLKRKRELEALGFSVYCIDRIEQIEGFIHEIQSS